MRKVKLKAVVTRKRIQRLARNWTFLVELCRIFFNALQYAKIKKTFLALADLERHPNPMLDTLLMKLKLTQNKRRKSYAISPILEFLSKQFGDDSVKQVFRNRTL